MTTTRTVLLANEPRAYRETIAVALGILCHDTTVIVVDPESLDDSIAEHAPDVVLCSRLTPLMEAQVPTWAVLYPDGHESALIQMDGQRKSVANIELSGIIRLVDRKDEHIPS